MVFFLFNEDRGILIIRSRVILISRTTLFRRSFLIRSLLCEIGGVNFIFLSWGGLYYLNIVSFLNLQYRFWFLETFIFWLFVQHLVNFELEVKVFRMSMRKGIVKGRMQSSLTSVRIFLNDKFIRNILIHRRLILHWILIMRLVDYLFYMRHSRGKGTLLGIIMMHFNSV